MWAIIEGVCGDCQVDCTLKTAYVNIEKEQVHSFSFSKIKVEPKFNFQWKKHHASRRSFQDIKNLY